MNTRMLVTENGETYFIKDISLDYHFKYGYIRTKDLQEDGVLIQSSKGIFCSLFQPSFSDMYKRIKRVAQIITPKDAGFILAETLVGRDSVCVDAGGGSGGLSCFLARYVKKIYCYDIREDHIKIIKQNKEFLGLKNLIIKQGDIYKRIPHKNVDLITLDVPEPYLCLDLVSKALKPGGFLVTYVPCTNQLLDISNAVKDHKDFFFIKHVEIQQRYWKASGTSIRPETQGPIHTGFISIIRRK